MSNRKAAAFLLALILVCSIAASTYAAESEEAEVLKLRTELEELKKGYVAHDKVLRAIIERLKKIQAAIPAAAAIRSSKVSTKQSPDEPGTLQSQKGTPPSSEELKAKPEAQPKAAPQTPTSTDRSQGQRSDQKSAQAVPQATPPSPEHTRPEKLSKPRISKGQQVIRQEVNVLFANRLVLEPGFTYSRVDRQQVSLSGFLALDAIFLGEISVDEVESDILNFDLTARYGLFDRLELDLNLPFLYRNTTFRDTGADSGEDGAGEANVSLNFELGDVSAGFAYQLVRENEPWPDLVWNFRVKAPTGSDPFGVKTASQGNVQFPGRLPSGNGIWALSSGLSFVKSVAPAIVFGNFSYFRNFEESFDDISSNPNKVVPGSVKLGDSIQFGMGFALAFSERMSFSLAYSQLVSNTTETEQEGGQRSEIIGSDTNSALLNFGLTYALSDHWSLVTNVGAGLTTDAPDVQVSMKFPYTF